MSETPIIEAGYREYAEVNEEVRELLETHDAVILNNVLDQRYIGCAIPAGKDIIVNGIPGNDLACYMDGATIEVFGNAQDQTGNTMNDGRVIIHGRCGDATGYAMRGGKIFVRDGCGWRVGIHMKQYEHRCPVIFIGGDTGSFLGEYMAGGVIVLLGRAGRYMATGMHGGIIYLHHRLDEGAIMPGLVLEPVDEEDRELLDPLINEYREHFADELSEELPVDGSGFWKLRPESSRPYADMYSH